MSADFESITRLLRMLPPPAVKEVADFADYPFHKHVRHIVEKGNG